MVKNLGLGVDEIISITKLHDEKPSDDYVADPVKALDIVEELRIQSGKFLYEYPARLQKVVEVVRMKCYPNS